MSKLQQSFLRIIYTLGNHSGCHQLPERSFFYRGWQFPVCARCTGVFIGEILAIICGFFKKLPSGWAIAALSSMGLDWALQELHIKESTNRRRFITGLLGGFGLFSLYLNIIKWLLKRT